MFSTSFTKSLKTSTLSKKALSAMEVLQGSQDSDLLAKIGIKRFSIRRR